MKKRFSGERFNNIVLVEFSHRIGKHYHWLVRCDCGVTKTVEVSAIVNGRVKGCGCFLKEHAKKLGLNNRKYSREMAVEIAKKQTKESYKRIGIINSRLRINELADTYVKQKLTRKGILNHTPEVIEETRIIMKIKRTIKQIQTQLK